MSQDASRRIAVASTAGYACPSGDLVGLRGRSTCKASDLIRKGGGQDVRFHFLRKACFYALEVRDLTLRQKPVATSFSLSAFAWCYLHSPFFLTLAIQKVSILSISHKSVKSSSVHNETQHMESRVTKCCPHAGLAFRIELFRQP
jgi:hypothetical protein